MITVCSQRFYVTHNDDDYFGRLTISDMRCGYWQETYYNNSSTSIFVKLMRLLHLIRGYYFDAISVTSHRDSIGVPKTWYFCVGILVTLYYLNVDVINTQLCIFILLPRDFMMFSVLFSFIICMTMGHYQLKVGGSLGIHILFIRNLDLSIILLEKYPAMVSCLLSFLNFHVKTFLQNIRHKIFQWQIWWSKIELEVCVVEFVFLDV